MVKPEQIPVGVSATFDAVWEVTRSTEVALAAAISVWPEHFTIGQDGLWCMEKGTICLRPSQEKTSV